MASVTPPAVMALSPPFPPHDSAVVAPVNANSSVAATKPGLLSQALLTPPTSISPDMPPAHSFRESALLSPPLIGIEQEMDFSDHAPYSLDDDAAGTTSAAIHASASVPLSKGALSHLDGSQSITPSMLAKHHLPAIMLGNGPRPIREVMGELTQTVPGFSRIPPAKARRIVVAALENRAGGGPDGNITFSKISWGRWDAHVKGHHSRDSAIGSFPDHRLSPPRSERSYAVSYNDSGILMRGHHMRSSHREHSGASGTGSSIREEDEFDLNMDMDVPEEAADKMSMDGVSVEPDDDMDEETDDEDWAAVGIEALRKASMPPPGAPVLPKVRAVSIPYNGPLKYRNWPRRPSATPSASLQSPLFSPKTPEEEAAIALMTLGSM